MVLHDDHSFKIYFGDSKDDCVKKDGTFNRSYYQKKLDELKLNNLIFLKQVHENNGICLVSNKKLDQNLYLFEKTGDFIITNYRNVGIGVITADCLPVIFYDPVNHVSAIAHVGWRGAILNIVKVVLSNMHQVFNTDLSKVSVYFGSSARVCCYQVGKNFLKNLEKTSFMDEVILYKEDSIYFDLPRLVMFQLIDLGIKKNEIHTDYNTCTICDLRFHSYRRSAKDAGRQATIVALK